MIEIKEMTKEDLDKMMVEHRTLNPDRPVAQKVLDSLDMYAYSGVPLGSFLECVISNDLFGAIGRADSYNRATLPQICEYIYNDLPHDCWGSAEKYSNHLNKFKGTV